MELEIRKPDDMHIHLRQVEQLPGYLEDTCRYFKKILVMPNTVPPITDAAGVKQYREVIKTAAPEVQPLMTFKIHPGISGAQVEELIAEGITAGKLYPEGVTTNSADGVDDIKGIYHILEIMREKGVVLCVHAEAPGAFSLTRESDYLSTLEQLSGDFPGLRIVVEHVSQKETIEYIRKKKDNFAATITVHHLLLTLDDILGKELNPHHFCKPIVKTPADREAVTQAAFSGDPRFFFGSDSAPHPRPVKESGCGLAGVYSAPVALPLLAEIFIDAGCPEKLEPFCSVFGSEFYGLDLNRERITLEKKAWTVPETSHGVVPLYAGRKLQWSLRTGE